MRSFLERQLYVPPHVVHLPSKVQTWRQVDFVTHALHFAVFLLLTGVQGQFEVLFAKSQKPPAELYFFQAFITRFLAETDLSCPTAHNTSNIYVPNLCMLPQH